jgi:hypothetical protein
MHCCLAHRQDFRLANSQFNGRVLDLGGGAGWPSTAFSSLAPQTLLLGTYLNCLVCLEVIHMANSNIARIIAQEFGQRSSNIGRGHRLSCVMRPCSHTIASSRVLVTHALWPEGGALRTAVLKLPHFLIVSRCGLPAGAQCVDAETFLVAIVWWTYRRPMLIPPKYAARILSCLVMLATWSRTNTLPIIWGIRDTTMSLRISPPAGRERHDVGTRCAKMRKERQR